MKTTHWMTNARMTHSANTGKPPTVAPPWLPATATRAAMTTTTGRATSALRSDFFMAPSYPSVRRRYASCPAAPAAAAEDLRDKGEGRLDLVAVPVAELSVRRRRPHDDVLQRRVDLHGEPAPRQPHHGVDVVGLGGPAQEGHRAGGSRKAREDLGEEPAAELGRARQRLLARLFPPLAARGLAARVVRGQGRERSSGRPGEVESPGVAPHHAALGVLDVLLAEQLEPQPAAERVGRGVLHGGKGDEVAVRAAAPGVGDHERRGLCGDSAALSLRDHVPAALPHGLAAPF